MNLLDKVREALEKQGVEEETIAAVLADLEVDEKGGEPAPVDESKSSETPTDVTPTDDVLPPENEPSGEPAPADVPPVDVVPESEGQNANALINDPEIQAIMQEANPDVPPAEGQVPPPADPAGEPTPAPFDPTELIGKIDEQNKTIEGLLARIESLENALKGAGVLEGSVDENITPSPLPSNNPADDPMEDILGKINRGIKF